MKNISLILTFTFLIFSCSGSIKSENTAKEEKGTEVEDSSSLDTDQSVSKGYGQATEIIPFHPMLGNWVGYFEVDLEKNKVDHSLWLGDRFMWNRNNKISISIDKVIGDEVVGHSVVAGNDRPFKGSIKVDSSFKDKIIYVFKVTEPGDDQYDGEFEFEIMDEKLKGTWIANKNLKIKYRIYKLEKREFKYDADVKLESVRAYADWSIRRENVETFESDDEVEEWISEEFSSATDKIYNINASNTILKKSDVENLMKGDLTIIRNTIYARHGYSFKHRPLRIFFDAQPWYIPVHTNIKENFTDLEKQNIILLLKYEKNASEYYDSFGRG